MRQALGPRCRRRPTILIVEDDAYVRAFLVDALQTSATVLEAEDGLQAVECLEERRGRDVDLALVDQFLPRRSGLEVLQLSREHWPWIPTIIMTGVSSEDLVIDALRAGARDYLKKPITLEELTRAVDVIATNIAPTGMGADQLRREPRTGRQPRPLHPGIHRAIAFVEMHFCEQITLADVARSAFLSKFHFSRAFHQETGRSFRDYLRGLRIARAKTLLADTRLSVTEIAFAVGFNDLSHFDKVFSGVVDVTPTGYRDSRRPLRG